MEYKANRFKFSFFLPSRKQVSSLEDGAKEYGGATKVKDIIFSNYGELDTIQVNEQLNELSIFIPSTYDKDKVVDNRPYLAKIYTMMEKRFSNLELIAGCKGSWYSDDLQKVIIEDITIIKAYCTHVTANDIMFMQELAQIVKEDMRQEGVSIGINDALAIV